MSVAETAPGRLESNVTDQDRDRDRSFTSPRPSTPTAQQQEAIRRVMEWETNMLIGMRTNSTTTGTLEALMQADVGRIP